MLPEEEDLFREELRERGCRTPGGEWGWRFDDVPLVVKECERLNFAILGGQVQFRLPDGTCEMYWLNADPEGRHCDEDWATYSRRSRAQFLDLFERMLDRVDFDKEVADWPFLEDKRKRGIEVMSYRWFMMYPIFETHWVESQSKGD